MRKQMVRLAVAIAKHIRGSVHVQTNPYYSYSTEKTVINALRMSALSILIRIFDTKIAQD